MLRIHIAGRFELNSHPCLDYEQQTRHGTDDRLNVWPAIKELRMQFTRCLGKGLETEPNTIQFELNSVGPLGRLHKTRTRSSSVLTFRHSIQE